MSDLDSLILTFQTQLSVVMETVLKTAMYEVTRLLEDGIVEEVRRRDQEVESLRSQLQWAARRKRGRCADCGKVEAPPGGAEDTPKELPYNVLNRCSSKQEEDSADRWTRSCGQEMMSESQQEVEMLTASLSAIKELEAVEEGAVKPGVGVKEEDVVQQSCSIESSGVWTLIHDDGTGSEPLAFSELAEAAHRDTEDFLRTVAKHDLHTPKYSLSADQQAQPSGVPCLDVDLTAAGLPLISTGQCQNQSPGTSKELETPPVRLSPKQPEPRDEIVRAGDQNPAQGASPQTPSAGSQGSEREGLVIKQEVIVDSDEGKDEEEEEEEEEEEVLPRPVMTSSLCSVSQFREESEDLKRKLLSHKAVAPGGASLNPKGGSSLPPHSSIPHPHRPIRRLPHSPAANPSLTTSAAHSQLLNFHPLNRTLSLSRSLPAAPLSLQRAHLTDKPLVALGRAGAPWLGVKAHHQATNASHLHPHAGSHAQPSPRSLLRCGQCGKCFPHPSNLKAHQQTHTGERPFCCSLCGRSFTKLSNLKAHRRVHTGERPYCCSACGKRFTQKCNLKRHQRIHLDV